MALHFTYVSYKMENRLKIHSQRCPQSIFFYTLRKQFSVTNIFLYTSALWRHLMKSQTNPHPAWVSAMFHNRFAGKCPCYKQVFCLQSLSLAPGWWRSHNPANHLALHLKERSKLCGGLILWWHHIVIMSEHQEWQWLFCSIIFLLITEWTPWRLNKVELCYQACLTINIWILRHVNKPNMEGKNPTKQMIFNA